MIDVKETKRALEDLLSEFGQTLPTQFNGRILKIGMPYTKIARVNGIYYERRSYIFDGIETLVYHSDHGSSIEELKDEMKWFIYHIEMLDRLSLKE